MEILPPGGLSTQGLVGGQISSPGGLLIPWCVCQSESGPESCPELSLGLRAQHGIPPPTRDSM